MVSPVALPLSGCIILLTSGILTVLAYISHFWAFVPIANGSQEHVGLWRRGACMPESGCWFIDYFTKDTLEWVNAVRVLLSITIALLSVKLVSIPIYLYISIGLHYKKIMIFCAISSFVCGILIFISAVVYGIKATNLEWTLGWCFPVVIVGGFLSIFAGVVFTVCVGIKKPNFKDHYFHKMQKRYGPEYPYVTDPPRTVHM